MHNKKQKTHKVNTHLNFNRRIWENNLILHKKKNYKIFMGIHKKGKILEINKH